LSPGANIHKHPPCVPFLSRPQWKQICAGQTMSGSGARGGGRGSFAIRSAYLRLVRFWRTAQRMPPTTPTQPTHQHHVTRDRHTHNRDSNTLVPPTQVEDVTKAFEDNPHFQLWNGDDEEVEEEDEEEELE